MALAGWQRHANQVDVAEIYEIQSALAKITAG
jgi:hypothetical protein